MENTDVPPLKRMYLTGYEPVLTLPARVNDFIVKQPPQYTDPFEEIRRASGHKYYYEADGQKKFNSIPLAG